MKDILVKILTKTPLSEKDISSLSKDALKDVSVDSIKDTTLKQLPAEIAGTFSKVMDKLRFLPADVAEKFNNIGDLTVGSVIDLANGETMTHLFDSLDTGLIGSVREVMDDL